MRNRPPFFLPDLRAEVTLLPTDQSGRARPIFSGYRPQHLIQGYGLTSGIHVYPDRAQVRPGETAIALIQLITPEHYPHAISIGEVLPLQEGNRVIGQALVQAILNPLLKSPHQQR